jgi:hypothetical protein
MVEFYSEDFEMPPLEMIHAKLKKVECISKQESNYFVFGQDFFYTFCFSRLKSVEFAQ